MSDTYRYRSLFRSAEYRLTEEGVAVTARRLGQFTRTTVPYDKIPIRSSTLTWSSRPLFWIAVVLAALFVAVTVNLFVGTDPEQGAPLVYGALCLVTSGAYVATRITSEVFLFEDSSLAFHRSKSRDKDLAEFIDSMQREKLDFLKQRLARRAPEVPSDEAGRYLLYLRENGLIDEAAYTRLRAYLGDLYSSGPVGFQRET